MTNKLANTDLEYIIPSDLLKTLVKYVPTLNGKLLHKTTQYRVNNYLQLLLTLLATFVPHRGEKSVVTQENCPWLSASFTSPKSQIGYHRKLGSLGSEKYYMEKRNSGVKCRLGQTHIIKIINHRWVINIHGSELHAFFPTCIMLSMWAVFGMW